MTQTEKFYFQLQKPRLYNCVCTYRDYKNVSLAATRVLCLIPSGLGKTYRDTYTYVTPAVKIVDARELCKSVNAARIFYRPLTNPNVKDVKERIVWESDVHSFDDNTAI